MKKSLLILFLFALSYSSYAQAVTLICPTNTTTPACQSGAAVLSAYQTWLNSASASGGCNGVLTNNGSANIPFACGQSSTTVTFTYTSTCAPLTTTCQATFTVANPPSVNLTCPVNTTTAANQTQAAVNTAFSTWLATAFGNGGCNGVLTNNNTGAPNACGGATTVTFTYTSTCSPLTTTCQRTFTVAPTAPTGISGTTAIVIGGSTTLNVVGGTQGGAIVEWFAGSCGSTVIGTGNSITVSPTTNTTYFVRYRGDCNTTTCASVNVTVTTVSSYNNAARNDFYGIGGYSFSQQLFPDGVQPTPYVVSGPSPQNDFSFAASAVGGITNRLAYISTTNTNTAISIKFFGNNVRKFGCNVLGINATMTAATFDIISLTATTNLGNTATQTGGGAGGQFVGFNVIGNENEYIVSVTASFQTTPSPGAFIILNGTMVGDNTPQNVALNFDGVDDYVSINNTAVGNLGTNSNFTVSCWIKPDALQPAPTGENDIISKWAGLGAGVNNNYPFVIRYLNQNLADVNLRGKILVGQWDGTNFPTIVSTTAVNDGRWHHVAFVKTGTILKLYIDGVQEGGDVTDNATLSTNNNTPLQFGRRGNNENHFKGEIDEVRIWSIAKTATEIANERFCKTPNGLGLFNSYNFGNGVPHDNNTLITQVQNAVNANHGTLNNFAKTGDASNFVTGQVKYVKSGFIDSHGSSWANAFINLQTALVANSCNDLFDVYVAKNAVAYRPSFTGDVNASFIIPSGMSIYGGFAGTEKSINQRNRALIQTTNETTLSGDLSGNDILSDFTQNRSENSRTVVNIDGKSNIILDGFSIRGGFGGAFGGGINADVGQNIRINHCKIFDNSANYGGGISADNANNLLIINTYLLGNRVTSSGHAIYFNSDNGTKNMKLNNCVIAGHIGFAIAAEGNENSPTFGTVNHSYTNCTFANNGNAISNVFYAGTTNNFTLKNSIIYGNTTGINIINLGGTYNQNITFSLVQGVTTGTGNLDGNTTNPQFLILPIPAVVPSTGGDFRLKDSSPCINVGDDAGVSPLDLDRNPRPRGGKTDMGAFESNINQNEIISIGNGNWESNSTWNLNRLPLATDKVILNGHQVTVITPNARAKDLEYKTGAILRYLAGGLLRFGN